MQEDVRTLSIDFTLRLETHALAEFKAGGHFIPGMIDEEQRRRPWVGSTVYVLELHPVGGIPAKAGHILRVVADSEAEAARYMKANIISTLQSHGLAQRSHDFSYDQMKRLVDRIGILQAFLDERFPGHKGAAFEDVFAAAMFHLGERPGA